MRKRTNVGCGFTLTEVLLATALASLLFLGLFSFFGDTLQRFVQHEDTLTNVRDLQLLLTQLRDDLSHLDGAEGLASSSAQTGTTFPKIYIHASHSVANTHLLVYHFLRTSDTLAFPTDDPVSKNLPPGPRTERLLQSIAYCENALAWVIPPSGTPIENQVYHLVLNLRHGAQRSRVVYSWHPEIRRLTRSDSKRNTTFAENAVNGFSARPVFEFLIHPNEPEKTAELLKVWVELSLELCADSDGGKIAKRHLSFRTNVTPKFLNYACKARWNRQ